VDLDGFAGGLSSFAAVTTAVTSLVGATGRAPARYAVSDLVIGGLATHKFSRLLARGSVTSPFRAPFTKFVGPGGRRSTTSDPGATPRRRDPSVGRPAAAAARSRGAAADELEPDAELDGLIVQGHRVVELVPD
jgi:hypothetical protein